MLRKSNVELIPDLLDAGLDCLQPLEVKAGMDGKRLARLKRRVKALQRELARLGPVMRGSVVLIGTRNKQPYFSLNKDKTTRIIYLGKKRLDKARESGNYKTLREIVGEMTQLNMTLLKTNYQS